MWTFGPQTMLTFMARYQYRRIPAVHKTPVALPDLSVSSVAHKTVAYFGYEFELPWDDVDEQKSRTAATVHVHMTAFHSGNALWFSTFPARDFVKNVVEKTNLTPEQFRQVYGDEAFESDLGFVRTMLQITPRDMSPFMSKTGGSFHRAASNQGDYCSRGGFGNFFDSHGGLPRIPIRKSAKSAVSDS